MARNRKQQVLVSVTFAKPVTAAYAAREFRNCVHGEFYPDAHGDMDPGVFRIRGVKRAPKGR